MKTYQGQLRQVIEHLIRARPQRAALYRALRKMLDLGALTFRWDENAGRPIKVWSTNRGSVLEHLVADIEDDTQAALILLFVEGSLVFTTDISATPEVHFCMPKCSPRLV